MAYISYDQNKQQNDNTTDVLGNAGQGGTNTPTQNQQGGGVSTSYVSDGNPYGNYATPPMGSTAPAPAPTVRKPAGGASSGTFTNVQSYLDKNKQSAQRLGQTVAGKLQTTSDIAKQNLQSVENRFKQGVEAGSLQGYQGAVEEAKKAYNEAATQQAAQREFKSNQARLYDPTSSGQNLQTSPTGEVSGISGLAPSAEDQALINANKARVVYGDDSFKDFNTLAEANAEIASYNAQNPGYFNYAPEKQLSVSQDRLSDILNAQYRGPSELSEIGGYGKAYNAFQDVSQLQSQVLKGGNNQELLERTFNKPTTEYSYGNKLLDQLFLGQGGGGDIVKQTAQKLGTGPTGLLMDDFSSRTREARTLAAGRDQEISNVKDQARSALMETANTRSKEVNDRINTVINDWEKYPQYFRDRFQKELDSYGVKVDLNKQFSEIANKYSLGGSVDPIQAAINSQKQYQDLVNKASGVDVNKYYQAKAIMDEWATVAPYLDTYQRYSSGRAAQDRAKALQPLVEQAQADFASQTDKINTLLGTAGGASDYAMSTGMGFQGDPYSEYGQLLKQFNDINALRTYGSSNQAYVDSQNNKSLGEFGKAINDLLGRQTSGLNTLNTDVSRLQDFTSKGAGKDFDPNAFNLGLSQLEAEALGVKGGEGLYNLLKEQGVDKLLKTKQADRNQLISQDEQSQLARLQSIAQLAKDYGVKDSGVNFANKYIDRDLAGQQTATSALDLDNFARMLQGAEKTFRTEAEGSNISGSGYGTGSSSGLFGSKKAQAWKTLTQNYGDLIKGSTGYRNIYSDKGVNKDLLKTASDIAQGKTTFDMSNVDPGVVGGINDFTTNMNENTMNLLWDLSNPGMVARYIPGFDFLNKVPEFAGKVLGSVGSAVGGSSAAAQGEADYNAYQDALNKLRTNITNKINTSGLKNQFTVNQNNQQDLELLKLLGVLDSTNL